MALLRNNIPAEFDGDVTRKIFDNYLGRQLIFPKYMNVLETSKDAETVGAFSELKQMPIKQEGAAFETDQPIQRFTRTATMVTYGLAFSASYEMIQDQNTRFVERAAASLANSAAETQEVKAAGIINTGFSTTYGDGVALFSASHPTAGGTTSNTQTAADLSSASLEAAFVAMAAVVDHRGKLTPYRPKVLMVAPAQEVIAKQLLQSTGDVGTAQNEINAFRGSLELVVNPYITDTDSWYLLSDQHGLDYYDREEFNAFAKMDANSLNLVHYGKMRFAVDVSDWRGVHGVQGA